MHVDIDDKEEQEFVLLQHEPQDNHLSLGENLYKINYKMKKMLEL